MVKLRRADAAHIAAKVATTVGRAIAGPLGITPRASPYASEATPDQPELDSRCALMQVLLESNLWRAP